MNLMVSVAMLGLACLASAASAQQPPLFSFETADEIGGLQARNTHITPTQEHATEGKQALQIEFLPADWPSVLFTSAAPWNWREAGGLAMDITNPGKEAVTFHVRVDDDPSADGVNHCRTGSGSVPAGKTLSYLFPLGKDPMSLGMRGLPAPHGFTGLGASGSGPFDSSHIVAFQIFLDHPAESRTLVVDNVRLVPSIPMTKIVDKFGQYANADWPGKLHDAAEFAHRRAAEEAELKAHPALPDRDRYGGWAKGPMLAATGYFRTEKQGGKWWLVTPEGHLFFSIGMDCVQPDYSTITTGREAMFSWLPDTGDPLARHRGYINHLHSGPVKEGATFDFYSANLERKYGTDYLGVWRKTALERLKAWGFNTIANWSEENLYRNGQMPYVATGGVEGSHARVSSGSDYWGQMHDPFDPRFAEDVATSLAPLVAKVKGDPYCLGYFVDNELSWGGFGEDGGRYGLAYGALNAAADSPAKQAFLAQLREKYGDIGKLNAAWGTSLSDWNTLDAPWKPTGALNAAQKADMGAFVKHLARQYFRVIHDYLKTADPDHLYLGCRFAWRTQEAVDAAAEYCDVVSFNIYQPRVDAKEWEFTSSLDKPCIIGEFHFGALDRGLFHPGLVSVPDQKARAAMYVDYLHSVLDNPAFVGCHWFQFVDEPLTGRSWDGENYNIGFLTVTDTPYPEMITAAKSVHAEAYARRQKSETAALDGR